MTHEELLEMFTDYEAHFDQVRDEERVFGALRSVVELHVPTPEGRYSKPLCHGCSMTEVNQYVEYPCITIRTIEKALL